MSSQRDKQVTRELNEDALKDISSAVDGVCEEDPTAAAIAKRREQDKQRAKRYRERKKATSQTDLNYAAHENISPGTALNDISNTDDGAVETRREQNRIRVKRYHDSTGVI